LSNRRRVKQPRSPSRPLDSCTFAQPPNGLWRQAGRLHHNRHWCSLPMNTGVHRIVTPSE
jgi:hypothetical protein